MNIYSFNLQHDGSTVLLRDGMLDFSLEAEKNSGLRHSELTLDAWLPSLSVLDEIPEVVAVSGWHHGFGVGYFGVQCPKVLKTRICGKSVSLGVTTHERAHIIGAYAMSPYEEKQPCYALVWEGTIGTFYRIDPDLSITILGSPLSHPGQRYSYLYYLGNPHCGPIRGFGWEKQDMAGKLMALAGIRSPSPLAPNQQKLIDYILAPCERIDKSGDIYSLLISKKEDVAAAAGIANAGVENPEFRNLAHHFSEELFGRFYRFARNRLHEKRPLLISGGCGLNCDWNTMWAETGLFSDVFVPPCANDSGVAIGAAADVRLRLTGRSKISWDVYAGPAFCFDAWLNQSQWAQETLNLRIISMLLTQGCVVAWVQGRCEIGPRALGNRSLLAAPFDREMTDRLNAIKQRESYRPIAPVCLEEDFGRLFGGTGQSPYMLFFQKVQDARLQAVKHDDGSARAQTVKHRQNPMLHALLTEFKTQTGYGVLCNTSLNLKGRGALNRMSDLMRFAIEKKVEVVVTGNEMYLRKGTVASPSENATYVPVIDR